MGQGTPYGERQLQCLRACASRNRESLGRLLLEFLWAYAFGVDTRRSVVSVWGRGVGAGVGVGIGVHKDDKALASAWTSKPFLRSVSLGRACCRLGRGGARSAMCVCVCGW